MRCSLIVCLALAACDSRTVAYDGGPDLDPTCQQPVSSQDCYGLQNKPGHFLCTIEPGCFYMGSPADEMCRKENETRHKVTLTGRYEITAAEIQQQVYEGWLQTNPSDHTGCQACPVEQVTWHEAAYFCNDLSTRTGLEQCYDCSGTSGDRSCKVREAYRGKAIYACPGYRLPTEAEWEYAARAGTRTATFAGDLTDCKRDDALLDPIAFYVFDRTGWGGKKTNAWGLAFMLGNVAELTHDGYVKDLGAGAVVDPVGPDSDTVTVRGGAFHLYAGDIRAARRASQKKDVKSKYVGFRCARTLP